MKLIKIDHIIFPKYKDVHTSQTFKTLVINKMHKLYSILPIKTYIDI